MPRIARIALPGVPHHVTQRGNNRQQVFFSDDDRRFYLALLQEYSQRWGLEVIGYGLMPNHVHLIVAPHGEDSLSKALGRTHLLYAQHVNRLQGRSGHLWQNRFYSCPLDERHCWAALRYAERNPVRAGMVRQAWRYPWSSAMAHVGAAPSRLLTLAPWRSGWDAERWKQWLRAPDDEDQLAAIRVSTHTGRPLGSDRFLSKLEGVLGRRLRSLAVGRPRRAPGAE